MELVNLATYLAPDFCAHHLQHDQLAGTQLVTKGHDGGFVTWHGDMEDVNAGIEAADLSATLQPPETYGLVTWPRHHNLIVWGDGTAPYLYGNKQSLFRLGWFSLEATTVAHSSNKVWGWFAFSMEVTIESQRELERERAREKYRQTST